MMRNLITDTATARKRMDDVRRIIERFDEFPQSLEFPVTEHDVESGYTSWAPRYDQPNPAIEREEPIVQALLAQLSPGTALDAACGTGRHAANLAARGYTVIGVDATEAMLAIARAKVPDGDFRAGQLESLPVADASVDLVTCALALTHVESLAPVMREFARVLRPGGCAILSDMHPFIAMTSGVAAFPTEDGSPGVPFVVNRTHQVSEYIKAFLDSGLLITACAEPAGDRRDAAALPHFPGVPRRDTRGVSGLAVPADPPPPKDAPWPSNGRSPRSPTASASSPRPCRRRSPSASTSSSASARAAKTGARTASRTTWSTCSSRARRAPPDAIIIAEAIEGAGGVLNAYTSKELTCYWNQVPFDKLALAMDVLADMYRNSLLDQAEIDRERTVVQQEIRRAFDQPGAWASELLSRATFGDQPIGWPVAGTIETVEAMHHEDFVQHVATYYVPSNSVLSVAGNTTHDEVMEHAERLFGDLPAREVPATPAAVTQFAPERVVVETREIAQCNMGIALHALPRKDPDRYALMVLNTILGRGMSSRLFKEVRERRGLAYSVGSGSSRYSDIGVMSVSAGVTLEHLEEATQVIRDQLFLMADEPASEEEATKARDFSIGNFRLGLESTMALAQRAGESLLMTDEIELIEDVVAALQAVTPAEVQAVAKRLFHPGAFSMAVVGPGGDADRLSAILAA